MHGVQEYTEKKDTDITEILHRMAFQRFTMERFRHFEKSKVGFSWIQSDSGDLVPACADDCASEI